MDSVCRHLNQPITVMPNAKRASQRDFEWRAFEMYYASPHFFPESQRTINLAYSVHLGIPTKSKSATDLDLKAARYSEQKTVNGIDGFCKFEGSESAKTGLKCLSNEWPKAEG